jgi:hypothetical protein
MLSFLKKLFGAKTAEPAPYKLEKSESTVAEFPFPKAVAQEKKPAAKKPRAPRTPKA